MGTSLTVAIDTAGQGTIAWRASGPRDLARLLRNARRHSAWVRLMRISVPMASALGIGGLALLTYFNPLRSLPDLSLKADNLVVSGTKITMEAPKLTGFTRDNRAYHMTADSAAQDITNPTVLELSGIRAKIEMQNRGTVDLTAVAGVYDTKAEILTLTQYIVLISSDGYEGHLTEAKAEVKKGYIVSEKPVELLLTNGKLNANRMEVVDNGALLRFDGGIVLDLDASKSGPGNKSTGKSTSGDKTASKSAPDDKSASKNAAGDKGSSKSASADKSSSKSASDDKNASKSASADKKVTRR